ncbi:MAG TPA: class I SAM-dependent methyltransferase [Methanothrix soehngenii]|nr:class I SAM-dependent methyltransferase [Methanothrix soehngenii]
MFEEIGIVKNFADPDSLQHLALFKDSASEIKLGRSEDPSEYFSPEYSHYIVVHTPLDAARLEFGKEWTGRFSRGLGVSIVERIEGEGGAIRVRGLMAKNGSKIYAILPYTHIDRAASEDARFPESRPVSARNRVWPRVLSEIKGEKILDAGCGFGRLTLDIARHNPGSQVSGIDILDSQTGQARMNAEVFGVKNVEFRTASVYDLPFEDGFFETVSSFFMLHHLDEIPKGLSEIRRVLGARGRYVAVEPLGHHHGPNHSGADWVWIFEEAGFSAEAEEMEGAVIIRARKGDE